MIYVVVALGLINFIQFLRNDYLSSEIALTRKKYEDEIALRKAQMVHVDFVDAENRRFADRVKTLEEALANQKPSDPWTLPDDPTFVHENDNSKTVVESSVKGSDGSDQD